MSPYMSTLLVALLPLTAFALPNPVASPASSAVVSSICSKDALYLQLAAPVLASTASKFCTTYIRSTISATTTITQPATATATATNTLTVVQKRATTINLATLAPSGLLSSACSCLLVNASPPPTTVYPFTKTATTTVATVTKTISVTETCASAAFTSPIKNGDFSQGSTDWNVVSTAGPSCYEEPEGYCFDESGVNFYDAETSTMSQSLVACAGVTYQVTITFKSTFCGGQFTFSVDGQVLIDGSNQACDEGAYPYLESGPYHTLTATFTAKSNSPVFAVYTSWDGNAQSYHVQSIAIAPAQ